MRRLYNLMLLVVIGVGMTLMTEKQAHAYADPGSSLLLLQTVGSVLTATGLYFRRRIATFFKRGSAGKDETAAVDTPANPAGK